MAARSAVSEMLRTRGSPVLILIAYLNFDRFPTLQEEFNCNIESLAKWIEGAIHRFRSGVKNSRVIELHDTKPLRVHRRRSVGRSRNAQLPALVRLDPVFDSLHNDPHFQKLVAPSEPKYGCHRDLVDSPPRKPHSSRIKTKSVAIEFVKKAHRFTRRRTARFMKYQPRYTGSWALVIGINAYRYTSPLEIARQMQKQSEMCSYATLASQGKTFAHCSILKRPAHGSWKRFFRMSRSAQTIVCWFSSPAMAQPYPARGDPWDI